MTSILRGMKNVAFLVVLGWCSVLSWAQVDDEFWFVAPEVTSSHGDSPVLLRFATFDAPADVVVDMPANADYATYNLTIPANSALSIDLTDSLSWYENQPFDEVLDKGIHITSSANISAYYEVNRGNNPDIFALKGKNALGTSFHLPFQNFTSNGFNTTSGFDVVATEDNTVVTITPSQDLIGHPAGVSFEVTLPFAGSTFAARAAGSEAFQHATGTTIVSNRPVAITLSDDSASGSMFGGTCLDLMGDQLVADHVLGTEYVAIHGYLGGHDRLQIVAIQNNTTVTVDGGMVAVLQEGESHSHTLNTPSAYIEASAPVAIWQSTGFGCELGGGQLPSVKCTGSNSTVFVRSTSETMRLNVLVPAGGQGDFLFNGNAGVLTEGMFAPVPGNTNWFFAQVTTLEGLIPVGQATRVENTSTVFHLGIINGGASSGTRFGYFSDYGALQYQAVNQTLNPCIGDVVTLEVDPVENGLYEWTGPNNFTATGIEVDLGAVNLLDSGTYVVQGFTGECEIENDTLEVTLHSPLAAPVLSGDLEACEGLTVTVGANVDNVVWTGPNGYESQGQYVVLPNASTDNAGVYVATLVDPYCPSPSADSLMLTIVTSDDLAVVWDDEKEFCPGQELWINLPGTLAADNPEVEWYWQPLGSADAELISSELSLLVSDIGTYYAESTTGGACAVTGDGVVEVTLADCDLVVPNVITPGNDNLNNRFVVTNLSQFEDSTVRIYNRWGVEVFSHDDFGSTNGWLPGDEVSAGMYYYVLHIARGDELISVTTEEGTTSYTEPGTIDLHGAITVIK